MTYSSSWIGSLSDTFIDTMRQTAYVEEALMTTIRETCTNGVTKNMLQKSS